MKAPTFAPQLLELVRALMRLMLVYERTPQDHQHPVPYNALEFNTIGALRKMPGLRATEQTLFLGVAPTTTSSIIARLVKHGWVERKRNAKDGRAASLVLSEQGSAIANTVHQQDIQNMDLFLSALAKDEQADLLNLLGKVTAKVGAIESKSD